MKDIIRFPYFKIKDLLIKRDISALEVIKTFLDYSEEANKEYNAFRDITRDYALQQAQESQKRIDSDTARVIEAMPIGVKDNFCTKGVLTTACSKMLQNFVPNYESTVTSKMFEDGGVMIGKTNMDEFAMGSTNANSFFGPVVNPHKANDSEVNLVSGGSSGGSAAAVSANMCSASLGSDTGGSIRLPASFTGVVGVKPTYGRCSRYGVIALASSLDQAGVFANNTTDAAMLLSSIMGFDKKDSTSKNISSQDIVSVLGKVISGKTVGIPLEYLSDKIDPKIISRLQEAKKILIESGANVVDINLPSTDLALPVYYIICSAEASSNLSRYDGVRYGMRFEEKSDSFIDMVKRTRSACFGAEVKRRIMSGTYVLSSENFSEYYLRAQKIRRLIYNDFKKAFSDIDIILAPTSVNTAFPIDNDIDAISMYYNDMLTVPASLAGLPALSIPFGKSEKGLPIGMQLIANHYDEQNLFQVASIMEKNYKND